MACMIVLYVGIPIMALLLSALPLIGYFSLSHRFRSTISHPYLEGVVAGLLCWSLFTVYLFQSKTGSELEAAAGISAAFFFGFLASGIAIALFYKRKKDRFFLFPPKSLSVS
jgi:hypothetical protein